VSHKPGVNLFRDRVLRGELTMEAFARGLIRMEGSSPGPPCLRDDQGARVLVPAAPPKGQQNLFEMETGG
jgi:hypothetical protein